jgi:hypothetical protein
MNTNPGLVEVGAMDPELRNSPIAEEFDEDADTVRQQVPGEPVCFFNGRPFPNGKYVSSGGQVLMCRYGVWVEAGGADRWNQ